MKSEHRELTRGLRVENMIGLDDREDTNVLESADSRGGTDSEESVSDNKSQEIMQLWVPIHWGLEGGSNLCDLEDLGLERYKDQFPVNDRMEQDGRDTEAL